MRRSRGTCSLPTAGDVSKEVKKSRVGHLKQQTNILNNEANLTQGTTAEL